MLKVNNIKKEFKKSISKKKQITFYADNNISFEAKPGEIIGILGPNGAGKTTLLRIIAGIMEPSEGNITIDEKDYKNNSIEIKKEIAYLSGNTKLYKDISPYELLEGVDSLGNPFSANNIYYKTAPGVYVSGSSDEATKIKLFSNETCTNLKNLFVVGSINGSPVPVLNNNNLGNRIEKLSTNVSDGGNRKHISDIRMCRDIYLRNSTYKPLK